ncbi:HD domain-containing phosphohydrolase [Xanthomonas sp. WHRI 8391]|uniref:Cyclic di-GMP phosphodiesterase response regulator RpfG n=1 Tax=Xanthomonas hortorum pv. carotae TaxID=487904 RepID=A0A6V7DA80_9XANT|nr:HD domain-containing phosphohydrolase [Xanthomonas hortorum]ETC87818.1 two-component system regulatory protein [Xanthomonas hortorum pv. carotae str. M081]MBG3851587.1 response regulator [Xanthomonas hortorum pv. carotae]UTS72573.1 response regulator [Xanthomonas hortorum]CAD0330955.1 Cyclic di-GMP phosphodiesterase response regulator RpfG [Xanthomonas hortorum pv. carotae]CAD0330964.1 Cyclic di-GMP phosphodiesterase response regulator RpfG [Xanthomonas hortorum pv. carotae]
MPSRPLLCVDDESSNLATLRQLLRDDFPLVFAKSGGEALDAVSRHAPALILLDVELPDMDGYAVARTLKQQPSSTIIPILFVTSRSSEQDERAGLEAGAADYVSKPYSPALLKARIATQLKLAENARLAQQYRDAIHLLGTAGQGQDADTGAHIWRMAVYARVLAETVGWSTQQAQLLQDAAPLHDAGKIAVPGSILHKPDALDEHERSVVRQHPQIGHDLLRHGRGPVFQLAAEIALHHHECWDGSGYPKGLAGDAIPESARIVAVADVFDALCGRRAYKAPWTVEDAVRKLESMAGKQLEPRLVQHFREALPQILQIKDAWDSPAVQR